MYKILAFDLDETIFNDERKLDLNTIKALKKAKDAGVKIVPASGRGPRFVADLYDRLDINYDDQYSILANGACVIKNKSNTLITKHSPDIEILEKLFYYGIKHHFNVQIYTDEGVYFFNNYIQELKESEQFKKNRFVMKENDFSIVKDKNILKALYYYPDYYVFKSIEGEVEKLSEAKIEISYSSMRYMELNCLNINKAVGLKDLCEYLNVDIKDTIAIGDNFNDLELIRQSGLGVAVKNAIDEVKEVSDYITKNDNNHCAICEVVEKFILSKQ